MVLEPDACLSLCISIYRILLFDLYSCIFRARESPARTTHCTSSTRLSALAPRPRALCRPARCTSTSDSRARAADRSLARLAYAAAPARSALAPPATTIPLYARYSVALPSRRRHGDIHGKTPACDPTRSPTGSPRVALRRGDMRGATPTAAVRADVKPLAMVAGP